MSHRSLEQEVRDVLEAAVAAGLVTMTDGRSPQDLAAGDVAQLADALSDRSARRRNPACDYAIGRYLVGGARRKDIASELGVSKPTVANREEIS